jgi:WD40 repeat protein
VNSAIVNQLKTKDGYLYNCRGDGFINCHNITTNELVKTFAGNSGQCNSIVLDDQFLYSAGPEKDIKKWNLQTTQLEMTYKGHQNEITTVLSYEKFLFSTGKDGTARKWDKVSGDLVQTFDFAAPRLHLYAAELSEDGLFLFTGSTFPGEGIVQWRISDGYKFRILNGKYQ